MRGGRLHFCSVLPGQLLFRAEAGMSTLNSSAVCPVWLTELHLLRLLSRFIMQSDLCGIALKRGSRGEVNCKLQTLSLPQLFIIKPIRTSCKRGVLLRRACLDDCTAALAAMPGGSGVCEEASEALYRARLLARRASAHVQLDELAAASGDYEEARP